MRLLVTRPEPDASITAEKLAHLGHETLIAPVMETQLYDTVLTGEEGDVFVATSRNGVRALFQSVSDPRQIGRLIVVGDASAELATELGFLNVHSARGMISHLLDHVEKYIVKDDRIFYVAGRDRKGDFEGRARALGYDVEVREVYCTEPVTKWPKPVVDVLKNGQLGGVLLYSERSAHIFKQLCERYNMSQSTNSILHFCLANSVANVFDREEVTQLYVADNPNENSLIQLIEGHKIAQ